MFTTETQRRFSIEPLEERIAPSIGLGLMANVSADAHASVLGQTIDASATASVGASAGVSGVGGLLHDLL